MKITLKNGRVLSCLTHITDLYTEVVGYKKDIKALLKDGGVRNACGKSIRRDVMISGKAKVIAVKLPCSMYHAVIMSYENSSDMFHLISTHKVPMERFFNEIDSRTNIPLMRPWAKYLWDEMKQKDMILEIGKPTDKRVNAWRITIDPEKLEKIVVNGIRDKFISADTATLINNPVEVPIYDTADDIPKLYNKAIEECRALGVWATGDIQKYLYKNIAEMPVPLMPPRKGHIGMMFSAGNFNGCVLKKDGESIIVKAICSKEMVDFRKPEDEEEINKRRVRDIRRQRETIATNVRILNLDSGALSTLNN